MLPVGTVIKKCILYNLFIGNNPSVDYLNCRTSLKSEKKASNISICELVDTIYYKLIMYRVSLLL